MRFTLFFLCCLFTISSYGQFETITKNGKFGFSYQGAILKKAKYDSLVMGDSEIITAYKKNRIYYFNQSGKKIHSAKIGFADPFISGTGIIQNKRGEFALMQPNGELLMQHIACEKPSKYGAYVCVDRGSYFKKELYSSKAIVERGFDSVEVAHNWLITTTVNKEAHINRKKGIFGRNKSTTTYTITEKTKVYDIKTTHLVERDVVRFEPYLNNYLFYQEDNTFSVRSIHSSKSQSGLRDLQTIDSNFFAATQDNAKHLFSNDDLQTVVSGDYDLFILQKSTIHALGDTLQPEPVLSIYDYGGKLLKTDISFVTDLTDGRFVFGKDSLCYIGSENGAQLSGLYSGIGSEKNGYRTVYGTYTYGYINDRTYEKIGGDFPVIGRKRSTYGSSRRRRSFIKTFVTGIVNTVRLFTRRPPIDSYSGTYYDPNKINIVEDANGFYEGYTVICLYGIHDNSAYDSLTLTDNSGKLTYNYMDTTGQFLSKTAYNDCSPFMNEYAWARLGKYTYLIDKTGKKQKAYKFNTVDRDKYGYFKVSYNGKYGIIGPNYEQITPCKHSYLELKDGKYFANKLGEEVLIFEIPSKEFD